MLRSKRFGFTLIELILVVAIIGLLMALLTPATRRIRPLDSRPVPTSSSPGEVVASDRNTSQSASETVSVIQP